jgi:hypothetical protein
MPKPNKSNLAAITLFTVACSAGMADEVDDGLEGSGASGGADAGNGGATSAQSTNAAFMQGVGGSQQGCDTTPDADLDADGWTFAGGDCNDCDPNVNPGAIEVIVDPGMGTGGGGGGDMAPADENCNGEIDELPAACDAGIMMTTADPMDGARAIELCQVAVGMNDWGVIAANWVRANGTPATVSYHVGVLTDFGPNVTTRQGENMLAISSGAARDTTDPGFCAHSCSLIGPGVAPAGFPQDVMGCAGDTEINDDIGLELTMRAPTNATGYRFDFRFYSNEYPEWVCTSFNDQFIALVNPAPPGSVNGNICFDSMSNPVSVNVAFFDVCQGCALGITELAGTDFTPDDGGTSWLQTTAPITGGEEFTIRFAIWDTGDTAWDSTTLIDNFQWIANGGTVAVGTNPVPE